MTYQWKIQGLHKESAEEVGKELEKLGDDVTPKNVVDLARNHSSILHNMFEWNDTTAAEKYRETQAREIIRSIIVVCKIERRYCDMFCCDSTPTMTESTKLLKLNETVTHESIENSEVTYEQLKDSGFTHEELRIREYHEEVKRLCQPLVEFLRLNYNPYAKVVVSQDSIVITEDILSIPLIESRNL